MDKKIKEIQDLQKLIDHRTEVENQAIVLISQCRFDEAQELLATLDCHDISDTTSDTCILNKIYGFKDCRVVDNGSWTVEQHEKDRLRYTCNIFQDGTANVVIETAEKFPEVISAYEVNQVILLGFDDPDLNSDIEGKVTFYKLYRILTDCWARDFPVYASLANLSASGIFDYSVHDSLLRWNMVFFTRGSGKVCFDFYFRLNGKGEVILSLEFFIFGAGIEDQYKDGGMNFFEESLLGYGISFPYYQEVFHGC